MEDNEKLPSLEDFNEENLMGSFEEEEEEETQDPPKKPDEEEETSPDSPEPKEEEEEEEEAPEEPGKEEPKAEEEEEEEPEGNFWEDVERITGVKLDVEYNGVDPETPEGAALREQAVADHAITSFVEEMKEKMPKVYKIFEHSLAGGSPEDLYKPGEKDYTSLEIKDDDEEYAKQIAYEYYQKKGLSSARIDKLIEIDEDSEEGIISNARNYLKEMASSQEKERETRAQEQKRRDEEQKSRDTEFLGAVDSVLKKGKVGSFVLPKKEATEFYDFVRGKLQRDGKGGYVSVTPLTETELEQQLQYEYFRFKKGDLDKLIQDKAKSSNARRLKRNIEKNTGKLKSTAPEDNTKKGPKSLKDFEQD